jgi:hypothetical protein
MNINKVGVIVLCVMLSSFQLHKFYVGLFQIKYASQKKEVQITARIFVDDLDEALQKEYKQQFHLGTIKEIPQSTDFVKKYLAKKVKIKINNTPKSFEFLSSEMNGQTLICYLKIKEVAKISSFEVENSLLMEVYEEQQNIIQMEINGKKQNLLLTSDKISGTFDFAP